MRSIRDVAVFAWAVTGINPSLANYGQGRPRIGTVHPAAVDGLPAWDSDACPTTYPPPEDLIAGSNNDGPEEQATARPPFGHGPPFYPSGPPTHGYRTRHASLDENMYDTGSGRQARWLASAASPYPYGGGSSSSSSSSGSGGGSSRYDSAVPGGGGGGVGEAGGYQHRRPSLRPAFSYDALQDHARHQQQAFAPASASEAAARRCNFGGRGDEPWGADCAAPGYGARGRLREPGGGESSKGARPSGGRYFWE